MIDQPLLNMKKSTLLFICLAMAGFVSAQQSEGVMKVKDGSDISKNLPLTERFHYGEFLDGKVFFRNGRTVKARLNYSLVHGEVQFIDAKKDTLILNDKNLIDKIVIAADTFYYYERYGHIKKVANFNQIAFAEKSYISNMGNEKKSAYGQYTSTSAISSFSSFSNGSGVQQSLETNNKILLKKAVAYFLIDNNRDVLPANRGSLLKLFPKHRKSLNEYFKVNNTNFSSAEDILKALEFVSSL